MNNPAISVVITTYKRPTFLSRAIKSVLDQTFKDYEIIVVDDNNTDSAYRKETESVLSQYIGQITYLKNEKNIGSCHSRNKGLKIARGKYIAFLDDDDELLPEHLKFLHAIIIKNEKLGVVFSQSYTVDLVRNTKEKTSKILKPDDNPLEWHIVKGVNATSTLLFLKKSIEDSGGWVQIPFGQENYLLVRIFAFGYLGQSISAKTVNIYYEDIERISSDSNRLSGVDILYKSIKPYVSSLQFPVRKRFEYNYYKMKAFLEKKNSIKEALKNLFEMIRIEPFNISNVKIMIYIITPYPYALHRINDLYKRLFPIK